MHCVYIDCRNSNNISLFLRHMLRSAVTDTTSKSVLPSLMSALSLNCPTTVPTPPVVADYNMKWSTVITWKYYSLPTGGYFNWKSIKSQLKSTTWLKYQNSYQDLTKADFYVNFRFYRARPLIIGSLFILSWCQGSFYPLSQHLFTSITAAKAYSPPKGTARHFQ